MKPGKEKFGEILAEALAMALLGILTWPILEFSGILDGLRQLSVWMAGFILGYPLK